MADQPQPQGTQTQSAQGEGDQPKYVTEEQLNRAITARFADFQKKLTKDVETALAPIGKQIEEALAKRDAPAPPAGTTTSADSKAIEEHPLVKGLQKQLGDAMKAVDSLKTERDAEKRNARDTKLRQTLADALTRGGISAKHVSKAVGLLVDSEKRVRFADDDGDSLIFRDDTGEVDFTTGLKGWLKTEDAKLFMPATGTQGSGDRGGTKGPANGQPPVTAGRALLGMAMQAMNGGGQQE